MNNVLTLENRHTGEILRMTRVRDANGEIILRLDGSLPPGTHGPPPHIHFCEREEGSVKAGTLGARVGDKKIIVQGGEAAVFPAGVVHSWWNEGQDMLEFGGCAVPVVDLDHYLQAMFAVMNAGPSDKPPIFYLAHVARRHLRTQALAMPPRAIQRILLSLIVMVGHILGKYRGEGWPGSPASCPGAPEVSAAHAYSVQ
jgi:mannose-6-phosphate isomerase-like protein (cupin superfamily)